MKHPWHAIAVAFCVAVSAGASAQTPAWNTSDYLAAGAKPWTPPRVDTRTWKPDFIIAADGSGTHTSVQAAIDALPGASSDGKRRYILVRPGTYRGQVCAQGKVPFTLYGLPEATERTILVAGHHAGQAKRPGIDSANPCEPALTADRYGTSGSASVALYGDDIVVAHLTVANDASGGARADVEGAQAVALMLRGDRILVEGTRVLGFQDTLYVRAAAPGAPARMLVRESLVAGDVDFVFGNATLVVESSTLLSRAGRTVNGRGHVLAPSTLPLQPYGFLVVNSRFVAEPGVAAGAVSMGRAWDQGVPRGQWRSGSSPNGQARVRDSQLGSHITGWAASTSQRPFSTEGEAANRFAQYRNTVLDAGRESSTDISREVLASTDGWAAAEGGTRGGADALPQHVFTVRDRAGLVAALAVGNQPKIVQVAAMIDLSVDDANRPLGYVDYRDPAFDPVAFAQAYDPATWGKKPPEGAQEEARARSAKRQADRVMIRVPSRSTIVGVTPGAGIMNGSLMLDRVDNVIIRHLHLSDAYDHFPAWDPKDNASGEWNSEYDNVTLRQATHVWVDHCTFDDGARPDHLEPTVFGRRVQHHDGLLDITRQSDLVTVSWNHFREHDKTTLVGGSDNHRDDEGKLRVTFHHNHWEQVRERTPRVRYGQVHLYNNLFSGSSDAPYAPVYSIGVGFASHVYSERNAWEIGMPATSLVRLLRGTAFFDRGSLHNGKPVDLVDALRTAYPKVAVSPDVGWKPVLAGTMDEAEQVAARVRAGAGAPPAASRAAGDADAGGIAHTGWTQTVGGRGGRVIKVTNLAADGPGSLKAAIDASGPRIVVFEVGGVIDMAGKPLDVRHPHITIAGQTAPSPGITVSGAETSIHTHDVIVQHLRFRPGEFGRPKKGGGDQDGISTRGGAHDVIVDHCSFSWATDENLSASGPRFEGVTPADWRRGTSFNITYSRNLIYEGLSNSVHEKGEHSKGSLIHDNTSRVLLMGNVYISNRERNALFKGGAHGAMVNNLIFNPGRRGVHYNLLAGEWEGHEYQVGRLSLVGNVMRYGPDTEAGTAFFTLRGEGDVEVFMQDNLASGKEGEPVPATADLSRGKARILPLASADLPAGLTLLPATRVTATLIASAGARPWDRDALDHRVLADMTAGRGKIIDSEAESPLGPLRHAPTQRAFDAADWNLEDMSPRRGWASLAATASTDARATVFLIGDSTMAARTGYGNPLCERLQPALGCLNLARGGRSTLSYRAEGLWEQALAHARTQRGAVYMLIQFGHNDQPGKPGRSTDLATEYPVNLQRYVNEARAAGIHPVLVTPLTRRSFKGELLDDQLQPWAQAMRDVARSLDVPLVDLHRLSVAAVQAMGSARADELAMALPGHADFDRTHIGARGACVFAEIVSAELTRRVPALARPRTPAADCSTLPGHTPVLPGARP